MRPAKRSARACCAKCIFTVTNTATPRAPLLAIQFRQTIRRASSLCVRARARHGRAGPVRTRVQIAITAAALRWRKKLPQTRQLHVPCTLLFDGDACAADARVFDECNALARVSWAPQKPHTNCICFSASAAELMNVLCVCVCFLAIAIAPGKPAKYWRNIR